MRIKTLLSQCLVLHMLTLTLWRLEAFKQKDKNVIFYSVLGIYTKFPPIIVKKKMDPKIKKTKKKFGPPPTKKTK